MARQNIIPDPAKRLFDAYMDFSGGLNSTVANDKLRDNEFPVLQNVDLSGRGSLKRRYGRTLVASQAGTTQGIFQFYRQGQSAADIFIAVNGQLYVLVNGSSSFVNVALTDGGNPFTFQTTRPINGVQYINNLYIPTGTKLVQVTWGGSSFSGQTVTPYTPTWQEAIYIGTNGLATNPNAYIQDGVLAGSTSNISITGIAPSTQKSAVGVANQMTVYISKTSVVTSVKYQWSYKKSTDTTWTVGQAWAVDSAGKTYNFTPDTATYYDIKVEVEDNTSGTTNTTDYTLSLTSYEVLPVSAKPNPSPSGIQSCTQCMIYWDRLLMWGDNTNPFQMYISDLQAPSYFPVGNTINFDTGKQESITSVVRFSDMLYVFTGTTIQGLSGKSPASYARYLINDAMGCVAPLTARVVNNAIIFLANEGLFQLTPNLFRPELGVTKRIDYPIRFQITQDSDACAWVQDSQYWLCYPDRSLMYRLYYDNGMWVQDTSSKLNILQFYQFGGSVYNLTKDGNLYKHNRTVWTDNGEVYTMEADSKFFDMEASFNQKKLRRIYMLVKAQASATPLSVTVKADSAMVMSPTTDGYATVDANGNTIWNPAITAPNWNTFYGGAIVGTSLVGQADVGTADLAVDWLSIHGKCRRMKVIIQHQDNNPCEVYGFGMEYKLKRANAR